MDASCKNPCITTSYGGIIRIRFKGRSSITSSQPADTSSPVYFSVILYIQISIIAIEKTRRIYRLLKHISRKEIDLSAI